MNENVENKVKGIIGLYHFYRYEMNTLQRVALLTTWIEFSVKREEYEVASGLQKELDRILTGEEEFLSISPSLTFALENEKMVIEPIKPIKKKLKFVNYWGLGTFELFRITFGDFKFVFFNFGFELK